MCAKQNLFSEHISMVSSWKIHARHRRTNKTHTHRHIHARIDTYQGEHIAYKLHRTTNRETNGIVHIQLGISNAAVYRFAIESFAVCVRGMYRPPASSTLPCCSFNFLSSFIRFAFYFWFPLLHRLESAPFRPNSIYFGKRRRTLKDDRKIISFIIFTVCVGPFVRLLFQLIFETKKKATTIHTRQQEQAELHHNFLFYCISLLKGRWFYLPFVFSVLVFVEFCYCVRFAVFYFYALFINLKFVYTSTSTVYVLHLIK